VSALLDSLLTPAQRADVASEDAKRMPVWISMTEHERRTTLAAMQAYGGSFVQALVCAGRIADTVNSVRLGAAMADYVRQYGPGSPVYAMADRGRA